jgi:hypothetical protein
MKQFIIASWLLGAGAALAQQSNLVPLTEAEVTKIEAANLKLQNLQLQFQLTQEQLQKLQEQYPAVQKELIEATEAARKIHNLGPEASLSQDGKSFVVSPSPMVPPEKASDKK